MISSSSIVIDIIIISSSSSSSKKDALSLGSSWNPSETAQYRPPPQRPAARRQHRHLSCLYCSICCFVYVYIYIYIYIERERDRERERD